MADGFGPGSTKGRGTVQLLSGYSELTRRLRRSEGYFSSDVEDVAQDACVRVLQLEEPAAVTDPVGYLLRVARNLFIDRRRSQARTAARFDHSADTDSSSDGIDPERILIGKQRLEILRSAIDDLPPRCREAFKLRCIDGLTYVAISRQMGISHSMVAKHLTEALIRVNRAVNHADDGSS